MVRISVKVKTMTIQATKATHEDCLSDLINSIDSKIGSVHKGDLPRMLSLPLVRESGEESRIGVLPQRGLGICSLVRSTLASL